MVLVEPYDGHISHGGYMGVCFEEKNYFQGQLSVKEKWLNHNDYVKEGNFHLAFAGKNLFIK